MPRFAERRVYFCHVVKTGGTALRRWLTSAWPADAVFPARTWAELVQLPPARLLDSHLVAGHFGGRFERFFPEALDVLTVVRNPVEHVVSRHGQMLADPRDALHEFTLHEAPTLDALLASERGRVLASNRQCKDLGLDDVAPGVARYWDGDAPAPPYADVPQPPDPFPPYDELLERALELLERCRWVGVLERLDECVALLAATLGIESPGPLTRENVGERRVPASELRAEDVERITVLNEHDLVLYRRACEIVDVRWRDHVRAARAKWCATELAPRCRSLVDYAELEAVPTRVDLPVDRAELGAFAAAVRSTERSRVTIVVEDPGTPTFDVVVNGSSVEVQWRRTAGHAVGCAEIRPIDVPWIDVAVRHPAGTVEGIEGAGRLLSVRLDAAPR